MPHVPAENDKATLLEIARLIESGDGTVQSTTANGHNIHGESTSAYMEPETQDGQDVAAESVSENAFDSEPFKDLPGGIALYSNEKTLYANTSFALALGYANAADLIKAGGIKMSFPRDHHLLFAAVSPLKKGEPPMARALSKSGRNITLPVAVHSAVSSDPEIKALRLLELYPDPSTVPAIEAALSEFAGVSSSYAKKEGGEEEITASDYCAPESPQEEEGTQVKTGAGEMQARVKIIQDAGPAEDRKQKKKHQGRQKKKALAAARSVPFRSDFLAKVSHEVRTPLNSIIGFAEMMKEERLGAIENSRYQGYIRDIYNSGQHALSLINDLLYITKSDAGGLDLNFTSVDLSQVIADAVLEKQELAQDGRVFLRTSICDGVTPVMADRQTIEQILLNLLSNAIRFSPPGGQVIISLQKKTSGAIRLRVCDTGNGMSKDDIAQAMNPFQQNDTSPRKQIGTGLGLPLTKALVKANHAKFKLKSCPGEGTRIDLTFPAGRRAPS